MDRAEAIERIEKLRSEVWTGAAVVAGEDFKALSVAIDSLREQELARNSHDVARACNDPLTLEGLRQMNGEPVWIVWIDGRIVSRWWIVGGHEWNFMGFPDDMKDYGKTWLAYCHKTDDSNASNALDGWISVSERLPEKTADVLMMFEHGNMAVGYWHDGDEHVTYWCAYTDDGYYTDCDSEPTHWMPLPEPPEEGG